MGNLKPQACDAKKVNQQESALHLRIEAQNRFMSTVLLSDGKIYCWGEIEQIHDSSNFVLQMNLNAFTTLHHQLQLF